MCINQSIGNVEDSLWTDVPLLEMTFHIYLRFYIHKHDKGVFLINYLMKKNCLWLSDKISRWPIETCLPECTADRCLFVLELIKPRPRTKLLQINWAPRFNQHCWSTISRPNEPLAPGLPLLTLLYSTCIYKTWRLHYFNPQHLSTGGQSLLSLHLLPLIVQLLVVQIKWRFIFHLTTCGTLKLIESTGSL